MFIHGHWRAKNEKDLSFHLGDNNIISRQETAKYLRICTDSGLKFSSHIGQIVAKAHAIELVLYTSVSCPKTETF